jgi:hypothetical protein
MSMSVSQSPGFASLEMSYCGTSFLSRLSSALLSSPRSCVKSLALTSCAVVDTACFTPARRRDLNKRVLRIRIRDG